MRASDWSALHARLVTLRTSGIVRENRWKVDGAAVEGAAVGRFEGIAVLGEAEGMAVGLREMVGASEILGLTVGGAVVVGRKDGGWVGRKVFVGLRVGLIVGDLDGGAK